MRHVLRIACVLTLLLSVSCRETRPMKVSVYVPQLLGEPCLAVIRDALRGADGVYADQISFDMPSHTVVVGYDSMKTAIKNIEHAIADLGFDANTIPANAEARERLPADCR